MPNKNNLFKGLCVGLLLITASGCGPKENVEPTPTTTPSVGEQVMQEVATWEEYEDAFIKINEEVLNAYSEDYVFSDEENVMYLKTIASGYEALYDGVTKSNINDAFETFRSATMLERYSQDDNFKNLAEAAKEYIFSCLGYNAGDSLVILDSFYSGLVTLADKLDQAPTQPAWYMEVEEITETETSETVKNAVAE